MSNLVKKIRDLETRVASLEGNDYGYAIHLTQEEMDRSGRSRVVNEDFPSITDDGRPDGGRTVTLYSSKAMALKVLEKLANYMDEDVYDDEFSEEFDGVVSYYRVVSTSKAEMEKALDRRFTIVNEG
jgi:hypothetical protein